MHSQTSFKLLLCILAQFGAFEQNPNDCGLPGMIPANERGNITLDSVSMPLGIVVFDWQSARIGAYMIRYLIQEVLGYNVTFGSEASGSMGGIHQIAGCLKPGLPNPQCGVSFFTRSHLAWEVWGTFLALLEELGLQLQLRAPENLGNVGFYARDFISVASDLVNTAYQQEGLSLAYYRSWNASWHNLSSFFTPYHQIDISMLQPCATVLRFSWPSELESYLAVSHDISGVETVSGQLRAKCLGGEAGNWWLSPACRKSPTACVPVITGGDGWSVDAIMQKSAAYDMPIALAVATSANYEMVPRLFKVAMYWWTPDASFLDMAPEIIIFPQQDPAAWAVGDKRTAGEKTVLLKYGHAKLGTFASRARKMMQNIDLSSAQFNEMLYSAAFGGSSESQAACNWLQSNMAIWKRWIPDSRVCFQGDGMIDRSGGYVADIGFAVNCGTCKPGTFSQQTEDYVSYRCSQCEVGKFSVKIGRSQCSMCAKGTYMDSEGQTECMRCEIGAFSHSIGSSRCTDCPGTLTTQYPGSFSEIECKCGADFYRDINDRLQCHACEEGMSCAFGADAANFGANGTNGTIPQVKKNYYTEVHRPLFVYLCLDESVCPGGLPGSCSGGRQDLLCSRCPDNQYYNGGLCRPCHPLGKAAPGFAVIVIVIAIIWMYHHCREEICNDMTNFELVMAHVSLLVTILQLMGSLKQLPLPWPDSSESQLESGSPFLIDPDSIQGECILGWSAILNYTLRVVVPYALLGLVLVLQGFSKFLSRITGFCRPWQLDKVISTMGQISQTLFISFVSIVALPFQCYSHPNHEKSIVSFPQVICGTTEHAPLISMAFFLLFTFVLPFFVITLWANWTAPSKSTQGSSHIIRYYFLLNRFRYDVWWWGSVVYVRQLCFVFSYLVNPDDSHAQVIYVVTVLWVYVVLAMYFWPCKCSRLNILENVSLSCMALFMVTSGAFVQKTSSPLKYEIVTTILIAFVVTIIGVSMVFHFVQFLAWKSIPGFAGRRNESERQACKDIAVLWERLCLESVTWDIEHMAFLFLAMDKYDRKKASDVIDIFSSMNTHVFDQAGQTKHTRRITNTVSQHMKETTPEREILKNWKELHDKVKRIKETPVESTSLLALCNHAAMLGVNADELLAAVDDPRCHYTKLLDLIHSREAKDQDDPEIIEPVSVSREIIDIDTGILDPACIDVAMKTQPTDIDAGILDPACIDVAMKTQRSCTSSASTSSSHFKAALDRYVFRVQTV